MKRLALYALALFVVGCAPEKVPGASTDNSNPSGTTGQSSTGTDPSKQDPKTSDPIIGANSELADRVPVDGEEIAVIETRFGRILLRFYVDQAPKHVENFKTLARKGFYDGTKFHRIKPDFMIQGGDPNSKDSDPSNDGGGGPGYSIDAEFNPISHERGILSMARSTPPNSAGSQFFIVHGPSYFLDTQYTVFGRVCKDGTEADGKEPASLKVVDKIVSGKATGPQGDQAVDPVEMKVSIQKWPLK